VFAAHNDGFVRYEAFLLVAGSGAERAMTVTPELTASSASTPSHHRAGTPVQFT